MNSDAVYAFYGSLRRGMNNYETYQSGLDYLFSTRLQGFQLYSLGDYPAAVETGRIQHTLLVEVFRITTPSVEQSIYELELGAGYFFKDVQINDKPFGIYLFPSGENYQEVSSGDWVDFFRKTNKS